MSALMATTAAPLARDAPLDEVRALQRQCYALATLRLRARGEVYWRLLQGQDGPAAESL